ncbi:MAG: site-specific DNA-methyltransferase [Spirochaetales bacterium]|nr:site-specific DNA-methyltransferase [Spirochaetales bacterium]
MGNGNNKYNRIGTKTSSFGISGRINHDSTEFYDSKMYEEFHNKKEIQYKENKISTDELNKIYCTSSEKMEEIPDSSIHLVITSPPYNVKKDYDEDLSFTEYRYLLKSVFFETYKKLVTGGRVCINIANLGRKPYIPLHSYIIEDMHSIGFLMRGEIIWNKASSASPSCAWGSWLSASNPVLRDIHEYILIFSKEQFNRRKIKKKNTIQKEQFLEWTKSIWTFPAVSAKSIGHPAPFPEELPYRLIQLYSFEGDVILDPFCGSGTTCLSAYKSKRKYIGYDNNKDYVELANKRLEPFLLQKELF